MLRKRQHSHRQDQPSSQKNTQRNQSNVVRSRRRVKSKKSFYRRFRRNTTVLGSAVILSICLYRLASSVSFYSPPVGTIRPSNRNWSPVTVGCYFEAPKKDLSSKIVKIKRLPLYDEDRYPSKRQMPWTASNDESQQKLRDSKRYRAVEPTGATDDNCEVRREWQQQYHPNCNAVHENDFTKFYAESSTGVDENIRLVASGYFRDVWKVPDKDDSREWVASKTLRYKHQFTNRNFDRHRRDALTTEETTASPYTIDIYAYCVHTMFSEFSDEGSLSDLIWPKHEKQSNLTMKDRANFALEAARGLEAVHFAGGSQEPSVAHTDISPSQFLMVDGSLKLNDFNRARFIPSASNGTSCPFRVYKNPGKFRSPEEYELADETEKIDIYSFGNVLFSLLTESWPFQNLTVDEAQKKVRNGERPQINMNTTDSHALMLMDVMQMSWRHNASDRPSSKDLVKYIEKEVIRLDISA